eukprot:scaffold388_cov244-Pinguiococcus_pyrenoidosus.AAC.15
MPPPLLTPLAEGGFASHLRRRGHRPGSRPKHLSPTRRPTHLPHCSRRRAMTRDSVGCIASAVDTDDSRRPPR